MVKNKKFPSIDEAKVVALEQATKLESKVPIYMVYSDPTMYCLWQGHEFVEWVTPEYELEDI